MKLYELAHARAGDKGNTSTLTLIAYRPQDFARLREQVTALRVAEHFQGVFLGAVTRYELPQLTALQFRCEAALAGGVTTTLALDPHGKSLSFALLQMELPDLFSAPPPAPAAAA